MLLVKALDRSVGWKLLWCIIFGPLYLYFNARNYSLAQQQFVSRMAFVYPSLLASERLLRTATGVWSRVTSDDLLLGLRDPMISRNDVFFDWAELAIWAS